MSSRSALCSASVSARAFATFPTAVSPAPKRPPLTRVFETLVGKRIKTDFVAERWDENLRLVASLKAGIVAPSAMLKKLAAYEQQSQLDLALQEIGRIERTLFMLDWLESPDLKRRCHGGLNKGEQRHALTQAICTFRQGRMSRIRSSCIVLITAGFEVIYAF